MRCGLRRVSARAPTPIIALYPPRRRSCQKIMSPWKNGEARRRTCTATLARKQKLIRGRSVNRRPGGVQHRNRKEARAFLRCLGLEPALWVSNLQCCCFFDNGKHKYARRFVSAQEACRVFEKCIHSVDGQIGITDRVVITDSNDRILGDRCPSRHADRNPAAAVRSCDRRTRIGGSPADIGENGRRGATGLAG